MVEMNPEQWRRLQDRLDEALKLPEGDRPAFVARVCSDDSGLGRRLQQLIAVAADSGESLLERPAALLLGEELEESAEVDFERLGPFQLLSFLGGGGMGRVFLARRDDREYRQLVAIKVLRREMVSREMVLRFRHERQILAGLSHPGIGHLLDGGTTPDGRPYLAMEYVEGRPLDAYCRDQRLGLEQRLELFLKVCEAVEYAHRSLVIHRDIKPGNILVSDMGAPKLLDFGIAKLLEPDALGEEHSSPTTHDGRRPMTLEYASPEQIQGKALTTATDVYSLGVLLYELLSGRRPYVVHRFEPALAIEKICRHPIRRPSSALFSEQPPGPMPIEAVGREKRRRLKRRLAGDLDRIVLKALAKDPSERYGSVEQLAEDLRRHRDGQPISTRPHTWWYRGQKFVGRHRWAVAAASIFVCVLLGLSVALWHQRAESERQHLRAEQVSEFLVGLISESNPDVSRGHAVTVEEILDRGLRQINGELEQDPALRASLLVTMGTSLMRLGRLDRAEPLMMEACAWLSAESGDVAESAHCRLQLAELHTWQGRYGAAVEQAVAARALGEPLGPDNPTAIQAGLRLARLYQLQGNRGGAEDLLREILARLESQDRPELQIELLERLAELLGEQARFEESRSTYGRALDLAERSLGHSHRRVASILTGYGALLETLGDYEAAESRFREAESLQLRLFGDSHPETATTRNNLASLLMRAGRPMAAKDLFEQALEVRRKSLGRDHPKVASTLNRLAKVYRHMGDLERSESMVREGLEIRLARLGESHEKTAQSYRQLAQLQMDRKMLTSAEELYMTALSIQQRVLPSSHPEIAVTLNNLAEISLNRGRLDEAERLYTEALAMSNLSLGTEHGDLAMMRYNLAAVHHRQGRYEPAEQGYRDALKKARVAYGDDHPKVGLILTSFGSLLVKQERYAEAEPLVRQALAVLEGQSGEWQLWLQAAESNLARIASALPAEAGR